MNSLALANVGMMLGDENVSASEERRSASFGGPRAGSEGLPVAGLLTARAAATISLMAGIPGLH